MVQALGQQGRGMVVRRLFWGMGSPRFSAEQIVNWTRKLAKAGGAITWDTPVQKNGLIAEPFLKQLRELRKAQGNTQQF
jgi:hypothetical protein